MFSKMKNEFKAVAYLKKKGGTDTLFKKIKVEKGSGVVSWKDIVQDFATYAKFQYAVTQHSLKKAPNDLMLYRGVNKAKGVKKGAWHSGALSSFSASEKVADGFGKHLVQAKVPKSFVWATHFAGVGVGPEKEFIVIGDHKKWKVVGHRKGTNDYD